MNRRSFLGWLGGGAAAATVAIYSDSPIAETPPERSPLPIHTKDDDKATPAQSFILKNEGETPMVISYKRSRELRCADGMIIPYKTLDSRRYGTEAILLPGEELRVTAVAMRT